MSNSMFRPAIAFENERHMIDYYLPNGLEERYSAEEYVGYVCYGSNMCEERFFEYLDTCQDVEKPTHQPIKIHLHFWLYFSGKSSGRWGDGGVAYISTVGTSKGTTGRMYFIKKSQLYEIFLREGLNYNVYMRLGTTYNGIEIYTFTSYCARKFNKPSEDYQQIILKGWQELGFTKQQSEYFLMMSTNDYAKETTDRMVKFCPRCGSDNCISIGYGHPSSEGIDLAQKGLIQLGGCCIEKDSPYYICKDCSNRFSKPANQVQQNSQPDDSELTIEQVCRNAGWRIIKGEKTGCRIIFSNKPKK